MPQPPRFQKSELEAVEFPTVVELISRGARTRRGQERSLAMHPWDERAGLRRLRQRELAPAWTQQPSALPVVSFDEALDEILSPAGWPLPEHWRQLRNGLGATGTLLRTIAALSWPEDQPAEPGTHLGIDLLQVTAQLLPDPAPLVDRLTRCFMEDGQLDPQRIPELAALHRERQRCFQAILNKLQKLLRDVPEALQEANIVERNGRFCLPLRQERKGMVPGLVLDRSSSGATVFVEPFEAVGLNNDFVEADREYTQGVQAFLRELLDSLRTRRADFERWHVFQSEVDEILALLRWQHLCEGGLPALGGTRMRLVEGRHPFLLPAVRDALELEPLGHDAVPLNIDLDVERPGLVISGSNTGGKTVVLKTVGLLMCLAQSGCAVPAEDGSEMPLLPTLHADIGDHQTLIGSLSTFSSHILHLKHVLEQAKPGGLVLLDELGTGTDPKEGSALGISVLQALARRKCWVFCSTHLGEISRWALRHARFRNASVQFDEERLAPTYRLLVGLPGQSRALTIAAKLGLPRFVLDSAERVLGKQEQDWREFLKQLEADRLRLIEEDEALRAQRAAMEKDQIILVQREAKLREQQEKFQRDSEEKMQRVLDFIDHESRRLVRELKLKQKATETFSADRVGTEARERVKTIEQIARAELGTSIPKATAAALREGGYARHRGLGVEGKVVSLKGDRAVLETPQGRRMEARAGELESIVRSEMDAGPRTGRVRVRAESLDIESEINLIGRASDDVDMEIHRFIEASLASGQKFIRIVHGHGTGRLKAAVRQALKGHPGISKVEDAPQSQGGAGATLIVLR
ncbi:MAG TPA: Smr/MutS family protein [Holophaga sp.]|nr:Smr/MutS family protein [Holophaga sp.]HPS67503.1 Smr/MutS family protein [Holophaga sp.]